MAVVDWDRAVTGRKIALPDRLHPDAAEDLHDERMWPDIDRAWAPLHVLVYDLGVVLLEQAVDRHLPKRLRSEEGLERWRLAATAMFGHGLYRPDDAD